MRFQLYQSHRLIVIGLQSGKKFINWVSVGNSDFKVNLQLKFKLNFFYRLIVHVEVISTTVTDLSDLPL